jgi:hypothetical protein
MMQKIRQHWRFGMLPLSAAAIPLGMQWYWACWIILGFGIPETVGIIRNPKWTLSDTVWSWAHVEPGMSVASWSFIHFMLLLGMVWLTGHFVFGIWR